MTERVIFPMLSLKDLSRLTRTNKETYSLFKKPLAERRLLQHVVFGEQEQAEKMLKSNPALLLYKGNVTDYSLRTFNGITAFQYALWALDRHMWTMLLKYLPREEATKQLHDHIHNQTSYKDSHGGSYDFAPLINALKAYLNGFHNQIENEHRSEMINRAQRLVPVHVVNEYCRNDRSFYPLPQFNEDNLPRSVTFYNYITRDDASWFPLISNTLRVDFARGARMSCQAGNPSDSWGDTTIDLAAIVALSKVRTAELDKLKQHLLNPAQAPVESNPGLEKSSCVIS